MCRAAIRLNPDYVELQYRLVCDLVWQGKLDEANAEYREVQRLNPQWRGIVISLEDFVKVLHRVLRLKPNDAAKAELRSRALSWLKAERDTGSKLLFGDDPKAQTQVGKMLQHWNLDTTAAGIRDPAALAKLPEAERRQWQALRTEVEALFKRTQEQPSRQPK